MCFSSLPLAKNAMRSPSSIIQLCCGLDFLRLLLYIIFNQGRESYVRLKCMQSRMVKIAFIESQFQLFGSKKVCLECIFAWASLRVVHTSPDVPLCTNVY